MPRHFVLALAGCLGLACLPTGQPPAGQHVISDRTVTAAFFAPSGVEGVPSHLLASGPVRTVGALATPCINLYDFPSGQGTRNGLAGAAPTVENVVLATDTAPGDYALQTDSKGRLVYVGAGVSEDDGAGQVKRFDLSTGRDENLALAGATQADFLLSASRACLFAEHFTFDDMGMTDLGALSRTEPVFVGDDLYYANLLANDTGTGQVSIRRKPLDAPAESLLWSSGNVTFAAIPSDWGIQLLISWVTEAGAVPNMLLDVARLSTTLLPPQRRQAQFESASNSGRWLLFREPGADGYSRLFLFCSTQGNYESWVVPGSNRIGATEWRPGHDELWSTTRDGFTIWSPGIHALPNLPGLPIQLTVAPERRTSMFTRDGSHWFSVQFRLAGNVSESAVFVGAADDPTTPPTQLNPWGEELEALWETSDGRLLVGASAMLEESRQDVFLVDPGTGSQRMLASGGHLVALGQDRALALLNWQSASSTGDLTLIDLETADKITLAPDVYYVAVDPKAAGSGQSQADALAPGTTIAFLMRNRLASPYDGLWVARLP